LGVLALNTIALHTVRGQSTPAGPVAARSLTEQRGDIFMARKMYREAIDTYMQGDQKSPVTWNKVGIAWHSMANMPMARKSYERSIKLDKKYADAVNNLGAVFYAEKKYTAAITRYKKAIQLSPNSASFWSNLGTAWYARGKYELMMESYTKAMELDPGVFDHKGGVGTELQERSVADRAKYHFEMAKMYAKLGKNDQALLNLRRSLEEGFKEKEKIPKMPEFSTLLEVQEFKDLMALEQRVIN
jgi:tetratricopeptide (TPR) repeat protein